MQSAIEAPRFATYSYPSSSEPHSYHPGRLNLESRIPAATGDALAKLGGTQVMVMGVERIGAIAREMMVNPYWPVHAAKALGLADWLNVLPENYAFRLYPREEELRMPRTASDDIPFRRSG